MLYTSNSLILIIPYVSLVKKVILANLSKTDALLVPVWFVEPFAPCDHPLELQEINKLFLCVLGALPCVFKYEVPLKFNLHLKLVALEPKPIYVSLESSLKNKNGTDELRFGAPISNFAITENPLDELKESTSGKVRSISSTTLVTLDPSVGI